MGLAVESIVSDSKVMTAQKSTSQVQPTTRRLGLEVFLLFLFMFLLTSNGRIVNRDGEAVFQVTRSIAERGSFDIPAESAFEASVGPSGVDGDSLSFATETALRGADGRLYAMYGLGQSLVSVPFYYLGKAVASAVADANPYFVTRFTTAALNPVVSALACAVLFHFVSLLGFARRKALIIAIIYGATTMAWPYSKSYFGEPLAGLMLLAAAYCLARSSLDRNRRFWYALAGAALGFSILTRVSVGVLVPVFVAYWAAVSRETEGEAATPFKLISSAFAFLLPIAVCFALIGWYNHARFGSPLVTGYQSIAWNRPFLEGLYGLLLSPGKGLLWYSPVLIVSLMASAAFFRRRRREAWFFMAVALAWTAFHASYRFWEGGWSWGPRLMLPILPFLLMPLAASDSRQGSSAPREHPLGSRLLPYAIAIGLVVQILGVGVDYTRYLWATYSSDPGAAYGRVIHQVGGSPLVAQWAELAAVVGNAVRPGEMDRARMEIAEIVKGLSTGGMSEDGASAAVLEQTNVAGLNFPDFWFIYLFLFGAPVVLVALLVIALLAGVGTMLVIVDRRLRGLDAQEGWIG